MAGKRRSWTSMTTMAVCCRERLMRWGVRPSFIATSQVAVRSGSWSHILQPAQRRRAACRSCAAVETTVLDGFGDVLGGDVVRFSEVGDGARHLQDAVVAAGGEAESGHREAEELRRVGGDGAPSPRLSSGHPRVDAYVGAREAPGLAGARGLHALADRGRRLTASRRGDLRIRHRGDLE